MRALLDLPPPISLRSFILSHPFPACLGSCLGSQSLCERSLQTSCLIGFMKLYSYSIRLFYLSFSIFKATSFASPLQTVWPQIQSAPSWNLTEQQMNHPRQSSRLHRFHHLFRLLWLHSLSCRCLRAKVCNCCKDQGASLDQNRCRQIMKSRYRCSMASGPSPFQVEACVTSLASSVIRLSLNSSHQLYLCLGHLIHLTNHRNLRSH